MAKITELSVNGKKMSVDVDVTASLLSVLRNDLPFSLMFLSSAPVF